MFKILLFMLIMSTIGCDSFNTKDRTAKITPVETKDSVEVKKDTLFSAFGNEPFWHVAIIENDKYIFHPMDGADVIVPWVAATTVDSITTKFASSSGNSNIVLIVTKKKCSDGMSDIEHGYVVDLTVNATQYSGCGRMGK